MATLRRRVATHDVHWWSRTFVSRLEQAGGTVASIALSPAQALREAIAHARAAPALRPLLDYDGTLVPFAATPELAAPDPALLVLLRRLAARPGAEVHVVSGRKRETLERWVGALPVGLHAEHGLWSRTPAGAWHQAPVPPATWREPVLAILREFAERTPGSLVEEKTVGLAWHYRSADPEYGEAQAKELSLHLSTVLSNVPVELLRGDKVLEVRPHGIHKGRVVAAVLANAPEDALLFAMGDDRTDEDLFAALPEGSLAVHVGPAPSQAPLRVADVRAARALLTAIAEPDRPEAAPPGAAWREPPGAEPASP
jgi:trehalose 6-phosphate synthase/phosphatase